MDDSNFGFGFPFRLSGLPVRHQRSLCAQSLAPGSRRRHWTMVSTGSMRLRGRCAEQIGTEEKSEPLRVSAR
jgi:hypothetical protein